MRDSTAWARFPVHLDYKLLDILVFQNDLLEVVSSYLSDESFVRLVPLTKTFLLKVVSQLPVNEFFYDFWQGGRYLVWHDRNYRLERECV